LKVYVLGRVYIFQSSNTILPTPHQRFQLTQVFCHPGHYPDWRVVVLTVNVQTVLDLDFAEPCAAKPRATKCSQPVIVMLCIHYLMMNR